MFVHIEAAAWAEILPLITPESSAQRNGSGCLPLHEALAAEDAPLEVLSLVLCAYPLRGPGKGQKWSVSFVLYSTGNTVGLC